MTQKVPRITASEAMRVLEKADSPLLGRVEAIRFTKTERGKG